MKPTILIIHYSQTGQLTNILESIVSKLSSSCEIEWANIVPNNPFPFPWKNDYFFDCMPESVLEIAEPIEPIKFKKEKYDLILLGYQPWFLSPSIPITSFLQSPYASILRRHNILTIIGARNMWLNAQEKVKCRINRLDGTLIGNIVFKDNHPNLVSLLTVIRWSFKGQKKASGILPEAGVCHQDIQDAARFGTIIMDYLLMHTDLHSNLIASNAIELDPGLIILEKRGIKNFRKFAAFIRQKGERENPKRMPRVKLFNRLLLVGVFILSPISALTAKIAVMLGGKQLLDSVKYFKSISYNENTI